MEKGGIPCFNEETNDLDQLTVYGAPVRWLKYTTHVYLCPVRIYLKIILNNIPFFFTFLTYADSLHPPSKIPVLNVLLYNFWNCTHDVIQVDQTNTACCKKDTHVYYWIGTNQSLWCRAASYIELDSLDGTNILAWLYFGKQVWDHFQNEIEPV